MDEGFGGCRYEIDDAWRIVAVDDAWAAFARSNDAPELLPPRPLGKLVLSYVEDRTTAALYDAIFTRVHRTRVAQVIPFRCDSPSQRRYLELHVERAPTAALRLQSTLRRCEERDAMPLLDRRRARDARLLRMCSFCKRVDVHQHWCEVEDAVETLRLFDSESMPTLSHGVCPACYRRAVAQID